MLVVLRCFSGARALRCAQRRASINAFDESKMFSTKHYNWWGDWGLQDKRDKRYEQNRVPNKIGAKHVAIDSLMILGERKKIIIHWQQHTERSSCTSVCRPILDNARDGKVFHDAPVWRMKITIFQKKKKNRNIPQKEQQKTMSEWLQLVHIATDEHAIEYQSSFRWNLSQFQTPSGRECKMVKKAKKKKVETLKTAITDAIQEIVPRMAWAVSGHTSPISCCSRLGFKHTIDCRKVIVGWVVLTFLSFSSLVPLRSLRGLCTNIW